MGLTIASKKKHVKTAARGSLVLVAIVSVASTLGSEWFLRHSSYADVLYKTFADAAAASYSYFDASSTNVDDVVVVWEYPYEGWSPKIVAEEHPIDTVTGEDCTTWKACFVSNRNCTHKCRDVADDLGDAPHRPGFVPPNVTTQNFTADELQAQAHAVPWVPDVTILRKMFVRGQDARGHPFPPPLVTPDDRELCGNVSDPYSDLNRHVLDAVPIRARPMNDPKYWTNETYQNTKMKRYPKIMCMVYSMATKHHLDIRTIRDTWGGGCDGFLVFSTRDDPRIPAISIPHKYTESYRHMWQKVRSIWKFVGEHYLEDFDFFHLGGEDMYVLVQNLRTYLADAVADPTTEDYYGGRRFQRGWNGTVYNTGGPGYTLSRATLRKFSEQGLEDPRCNPTARGSAEDVFLATCLRKAFNVTPRDTRDETQRERFHHFPPEWLFKKGGKRGWHRTHNYNWPYKEGRECCATDSIGFHRMRRPAEVRHVHALLYFCNNPQLPQ